MSRFFRSATSSSSSETDSDKDSDDLIDESAGNNSGLKHGSASTEKARTTSQEPKSPPVPSREAVAEDDIAVRADNAPSYRPTAIDHRDALLHALLEERCLNEAVASDGNLHSRESPEIQAQAKARYQRISTQLASLNLISTGLANESHAKTRRRYRTGLDFLSQSSSTTVPVRLRRLLTDSDADWDAHRLGESERFLPVDRNVGHQPEPIPYPLRRLITGAEHIERQHEFTHSASAMYASNTSLTSGSQRFLQPRYSQEFEELSMLGKGGYGVVYRVRHRLDNQSYAVKKVALNANRVNLIHERGQLEVDEVLRELRTLARLDHPNIVRYHTSWIEWTTDSSATRRDGPSVDTGVISTSSVDAVLGAPDESKTDYSARVATTNGTDQIDILFETSGHDQSHNLVELPHSAHLNPHSLDGVDSYLVEKKSGTAHSVVEGTEDLSDAVPQSHQSLNQPTLMLHMQMSLHPMTLAEYLAPMPMLSDPHAPPPLSHCFHLQPSVAILQSILNGIEYLHDKGMVHRDIKPANIFLGTTSGTEHVQDLTCSHCRAQRKATPVPLDVRIGDFGLVTLGDPTQVNLSKSKAVGTELYRSVTAEVSSYQLDIHALGIVAFELLWKFETRMERIHDIRRLKEGHLPEGFATRLGRHGESVAKCIRSMILPAGIGLSVREIKEVLVDLQKTL